MYALDTTAPATVDLVIVPARGEHPPVIVTFNAQPSPLSLRRAREAAAAERRKDEPDPADRAADAFTAALLRYNMRAWAGIIGADGAEIQPTPDREIRDDAGTVTGIEPGTITAFLADPRLTEGADAAYVVPWVMQDVEKNGFAPSPAGISAGAMPDTDIATSPATRGASADAAPTRKPARKAAPTNATRRKRTQAKRSGS